MNKEILSEHFRDIIALGGIPFYFLEMARSFIGDYHLYTYQLIIVYVLWESS